MSVSLTQTHRLLVLALALAVALVAASSAHAAQFVVTTTSDAVNGGCTSTTCSLRDAVIAANASADDDNITLPEGTYRLTIPNAAPGAAEDEAATGDLDLRNNGNDSIISESGARRTIIDATDLGDRVFHVLAGNDPDDQATITAVTITGGTAVNGVGDLIVGGGVLATGSLNMADTVVRGNQTLTTAEQQQGAGAGITAFGRTFTFENSTVSSNASGLGGSGIFVEPTERLALTNNTISDNVADSNLDSNTDQPSSGAGGFIRVREDVQLDMRNNTIANNRAIGPQPATSPFPLASGVNTLIQPGGTRAVSGNIIANNTRAGDPAAQCSVDVGTAQFTSTGVNLDSDSSCFTGASDLHTDPQLGALTDNGGQTDTMAITKASPAFDAGESTGSLGILSTDQRGFTRPQFAASDLGAFELQPQADLSLGAVGNPATISVGDTVNLTFTVKNTGDVAFGTVLGIGVPTGLTVVSATPSQGACSADDGNSASQTCGLDNIADGGEATVSIIARADTAGRYDITADTGSDTTDPNADNNSATVSTQVNEAQNGSASPALPTSVTGLASRLRQHSATVAGAVDPKGTQTRVFFEYGTTTNYGQRTEPQVVSGSQSANVTALVTGLRLGVTYHYRLVSVNEAGVTYGADATFRTLGRLTPRLSIRVSPKRDRKAPFVVTTSGRVSLPKGVTAKDGCSGRVAVTVKRGKRTISNRRYAVKSNCTYRARITFRRYPASFRGTVKVQTRFGGNKALKPKGSKRATVRFGR